MNKIDLIIENIEYAKLVNVQAHRNELLDEALAAAHELLVITAELLEALKHCRQKMAHMIAHGEWYTPETAIYLANAAIAKAEVTK